MIISRPKSWLRFKPSLCKSCVANCCKNWPVEVSIPDLIRLELLSEEESIRDLDKAIKRIQKQGLLKKFRKKDMVGVLEHKPNKDCIFLDENERCTVYSKRPRICREFPKIGARPGYCPYEKKESHSE